MPTPLQDSMSTVIDAVIRNPALPLRAPGNLILEEDVFHAQIEARGHIIVHGLAEHCSLESETGSVFLLYGSVQYTRIKAGGNIYVKHSVDSGLTAAGDIIIEKSVRQSMLRAGGKVISEADDGRLIGGRTEAGTSVAVAAIGAPDGPATTVVVTNPQGVILFDEVFAGTCLQIGPCTLTLRQRHGRGLAQLREGRLCLLER